MGELKRRLRETVANVDDLDTARETVEATSGTLRRALRKARKSHGLLGQALGEEDDRPRGAVRRISSSGK